MSLITKRFIAGTVSIFVFFSGVIVPSPQVSAAPIPDSVSLNPVLNSISIPADLGHIDSAKLGLTGPVVFHIQTAHGNYEAQKNVARILHHLKKNYGVRTVFVEGSAVPLDSRILRFFPDHREMTREILDDLVRDGLVKGPELFLADEPDARGFGIEEISLYRQNVETFREVLKAIESSETFLKEMDRQIRALAGAYLSRDLRAFLDRKEAFDDHRWDFQEWLGFLKKSAEGYLSLDLEDAGSQIDWPMLLRFYQLEHLEKESNPQALEREKAEFLDTLRRVSLPLHDELTRLLSPASLTGSPKPETVFVIEDVMAVLGAQFNYDAFPEFKKYIARIILRSEIKSDRLMREVELLTQKIIDQQARTEEEKKLVNLLDAYRLLRLLVKLELAPSDYDQILSSLTPVPGDENRVAIRPSELTKAFRDVNHSRKIKDLRFKNVKQIEAVFEKAMDFYRLVKRRDGVMIENMFRTMQSHAVDRAAVITGGFHVEPFKESFDRYGLTYAVITPKLPASAGAGKTGREVYRESVFQSASNVLSRETMETAPRAIPPRQISRHGFDPFHDLGLIVQRSLEYFARNGRLDEIDDFFNQTRHAQVFGYRYTSPAQTEDGRPAVVVRWDPKRYGRQGVHQISIPRQKRSGLAGLRQRSSERLLFNRAAPLAPRSEVRNDEQTVQEVAQILNRAKPFNAEVDALYDEIITKVQQADYEPATEQLTAVIERLTKQHGLSTDSAYIQSLWRAYALIEGLAAGRSEVRLPDPIIGVDRIARRHTVHIGAYPLHELQEELIRLLTEDTNGLSLAEDTDIFETPAELNFYPVEAPDLGVPLVKAIIQHLEVRDKERSIYRYELYSIRVRKNGQPLNLVVIIPESLGGASPLQPSDHPTLVAYAPLPVPKERVPPAAETLRVDRKLAGIVPDEPEVVRSEVRQLPATVLLADNPANDGTVMQIRELLSSFGPSVRFSDRIGIGKIEEDLKRAIEDENPTVVLIRSDTKSFKSADFLRWAYEKGVRAIIRMGAGVDNVDLNAARSAGISVIRTHGNANSVGNLANRFLFASLRGEVAESPAEKVDLSFNEIWKKILDVPLTQFENALKKSKEAGRGVVQPEHQRRALSPISVKEILELAKLLEGKNISIAGFAPTALATIEKLDAIRKLTGVQFNILATSPSLDRGDAGRVAIADRLNVLHPGEDEVLKRADILLLHRPAGEKSFLNASSLEKLPKLQILINAARQDLIDTSFFEPFFARPGAVYFADVDLAVKGNPIAELQDLISRFPAQFVALPHIAASTKNAAEGVEINTLPTLEGTLERLLGLPVSGSIDIVNNVNPQPIRFIPDISGTRKRDFAQRLATLLGNSAAVSSLNRTELDDLSRGLIQSAETAFQSAPDRPGARLIRRLAAQLKAEGEVVTPKTIFEVSGHLMLPLRQSADSVITNIVGTGESEVLTIQGIPSQSWNAPSVDPQTGVQEVPEFSVPMDRLILESGNVLYFPPPVSSGQSRAEVRAVVEIAIGIGLAGVGIYAGTHYLKSLQQRVRSEKIARIEADYPEILSAIRNAIAREISASGSPYKSLQLQQYFWEHFPEQDLALLNEAIKLSEKIEAPFELEISIIRVNSKRRAHFSIFDMTASAWHWNRNRLQGTGYTVAEDHRRNTYYFAVQFVSPDPSRFSRRSEVRAVERKDILEAIELVRGVVGRGSTIDQLLEQSQRAVEQADFSALEQSLGRVLNILRPPVKTFMLEAPENHPAVQALRRVLNQLNPAAFPLPVIQEIDEDETGQGSRSEVRADAPAGIPKLYALIQGLSLPVSVQNEIILKSSAATVVAPPKGQTLSPEVASLAPLGLRPGVVLSRRQPFDPAQPEYSSIVVLKGVSPQGIHFVSIFDATKEFVVTFPDLFDAIGKKQISLLHPAPGIKGLKKGNQLLAFIVSEPSDYKQQDAINVRYVLLAGQTVENIVNAHGIAKTRPVTYFEAADRRHTPINLSRSIAVGDILEVHYDALKTAPEVPLPPAQTAAVSPKPVITTTQVQLAVPTAALKSEVQGLRRILTNRDTADESLLTVFARIRELGPEVDQANPHVSGDLRSISTNHTNPLVQAAAKQTLQALSAALPAPGPAAADVEQTLPEIQEPIITRTEAPARPDTEARSEVRDIVPSVTPVVAPVRNIQTIPDFFVPGDILNVLFPPVSRRLSVQFLNRLIPIQRQDAIVQNIRTSQQAPAITLGAIETFLPGLNIRSEVFAYGISPQNLINFVEADETDVLMESKSIEWYAADLMQGQIASGGTVFINDWLEVLSTFRSGYQPDARPLFVFLKMVEQIQQTASAARAGKPLIGYMGSKKELFGQLKSVLQNQFNQLNRKDLAEAQRIAEQLDELIHVEDVAEGSPLTALTNVFHAERGGVATLQSAHHAFLDSFPGAANIITGAQKIRGLTGRDRVLGGYVLAELLWRLLRLAEELRDVPERDRQLAIVQPYVQQNFSGSRPVGSNSFEIAVDQLITQALQKLRRIATAA